MGTNIYRKRRFWLLVLTLLIPVLSFALSSPTAQQRFVDLWREFVQYDLNIAHSLAPDKNSLSLLSQLPVKGRAAKTTYRRDSFARSWQVLGKCSVRNLVLKRDLTAVQIDNDCKVLSGRLLDPYSGKYIDFRYGPATSREVQIDHVVAISDAWQKGAQSWSSEKRYQFYNDLDNLLAVSGEVNQAKSDGDVATWLPPNKSFRCQYVAQQIKIKLKYGLWVTAAEKQVMNQQLQKCPKLVQD